ncbi:MAG: 4Fe-4S dicluster domain-containing protein [Acidobacteriota bacterium]
MKQAIIESRDFQKLIDVLIGEGFQVMAPTISDGAIVYDRVESVQEFPIGWTDEQEAGIYRLKKRHDQALFGYVVGPHSWKKFLHPPTVRLWQARRDANGLHFIEARRQSPKFAFLGVRACEIHAIEIQDRVFLQGQITDQTYATNRENLFIVAVNCTQPGNTCFCTSMKTGPKATRGFDLSLTEILQDNQHYFVVESGSERGEAILEQIPHRQSTDVENQHADELLRQSAEHMGRQLNTDGIKELLYRNMEHPRWDDVAKRCLTCANCTMVCPTCFCTTVEDVTDLRGEHAERVRKWDSCFTLDFSYIHGGNVRHSTKSRYRQWMTHKLASWIDQFGSSGCVGCGRCITWCPVGIDITEETRAIRESENATSETATSETATSDIMASELPDKEV